MLLDIPDILIFFGRFHPLVVHLPIGILLLAAILALLSRKEKFKKLSGSVDFVLLIGAVSSALACILGYLLSLSGDYNPENLFLHQWLGISLAVISFAIYWVRTSGSKKLPSYLVANNHFGFWGILLLITLTGHLGGNLTHGSEYLFQFAPDPIRAVAGLGPKPIPRPPVTDLDSADIFLDVVQPLVQAKCQSCHNSSKNKGQLLLTSYDEMLEGGKTGPSVVPGDLTKSELYHRITLPTIHKDYMPAEGKEGFDEDQLALIKWWIENQAPPTMLLAEMNPEAEIKTKFQRVLGLSSSEGRLPNRAVAAADSESLEQAKQQGFIIKSIIPESNFLEVRLPYTGQTLKDLDINSLLALKEQITWVNLSNGEVEDKDLEVLGQLKNISRLQLSNNAISDEGIQYLKDMEELRYLNLYGTEVTDNGLNMLKSLKRLQSLYLWQTEVSEGAVESFRKERPDINVTLGSLGIPMEEGDVTPQVES